MKYIVYCLILMLLASMAYAQLHQKNFQLGKYHTKPPIVNDANITYVKFASSISGPFTSDITLTVGDSLFVKADVTPLGSVVTSYFVDVNENHVIDPGDVPIGIEVFHDNNTMPPGSIDLDPTEGTIISLVETETPPSMTVIVLSTEGEDSVTGIVKFQNRPATFALSGHIYDQIGHGIGGAWAYLSDSTGMVGDASDTLGYYSIPINAGTYVLSVEHMSGKYVEFDTTISISGNMLLDVTLSELTSYIRGYVRDENSNPLENIEIWNDRGGNALTNASGMYLLMIPAGSGQIGLNDMTTLPSYLNPQTHNYTLAEGDSIVNNSISNFTCYSANSTISGHVSEHGVAPSRSYRLFGSSDVLQSYTFAISDPSTGNYSLPVHSSMLMPMYNISLDNWDTNYPWLPGHYPDTMYTYVSPAASGINFNFIPAETLFIEPFAGNTIQPNWNDWNWYWYGNINVSGSNVILEDNRLKVQNESFSGKSGLGIFTKRPFRINDREYRVYMDNTMLTETNNSARIIFSDMQWFSNDPDGFKNSLQLIFERNMLNQRQWRLMRTINGVSSNLWTSTDSTGHHILFQFVHPDTLVLKIHGIEDFRGPWGNHLSIAYVYLTEFNTYGETVAPVYFDELFIGPIGTTSVREIGGPQPREFSIKQSYPNPFNPISLIEYEIPVQSYVSIDVYNILGEHVANLVNELQNAGRYVASFDGSQLPSGVYYYRMNVIDPVNGILKASEIRKSILIK
jgi:Secretion system C-terminal sorting domain